MGQPHVTRFTVAAILIAAATAHAQPGATAPAPVPTAAPTGPTPPQPGTVEADRLFEQARTLLLQNRATEACPLLEQSYQLDPARGTLLNLASCYELVGRNAQALITFRAVHTLALAANDQARIDASTAEIAKLEAIVHRLAITVDGPELPGLVVEVNGTPVAAADRADWPVESVATPLEIRATAPGHLDSTTAVTLPAVVGTAPIAVPLLELAPSIVLQPRPVPLLPPPRAPHRDRGRVVIAGVVAGAGVVLFAASTGLAFSARSKYQDADGDLCGDYRCNLASVKAARHRGNLATGVGIAGLAAVATGVVLFVTAPQHATEAPPIAIVPTSGGALATYGGTF